MPPIKSTPPDASEDRGHLSETIAMHRWLRLLIVVATCLLLVAAVAVTVRLLAAIHHTVLLFALGGLLAYAFDPLVERARGLARRGQHPRWAGVLIVFGVLFGLFFLGGVLLSAQLTHQVQVLVRDHAAIEQRGRQLLADTDAWLAARSIHVNLEQYLSNPPSNVKSWGEVVAHSTVSTLAALSRSVVEGLLVVLIALYFLLYSQEMRERVNAALPERLLPYAVAWETDVSRVLGGFVRGQLLLALALGVAAAVACGLLGVRLWLLIGIFVVFAALIPVVGPFIGAFPAVIAALLTPAGHGLTPLTRAIIVVILFFLINEFGSKVLYPRLVGVALGLHEVLVLFILLAGFEVGGLWGVLFAAPLTALAVVTLVQLYRLWQGEPPVSVALAARRASIKAAARGTP
ncbi:MAG TPA: AI-2E family transporter [Chthonomonadaceae bacterium]|nr:AI-2E family transporter [Chthonomonadaceae bacterium]